MAPNQTLEPLKPSGYCHPSVRKNMRTVNAHLRQFSSILPETALRHVRTLAEPIFRSDIGSRVKAPSTAAEHPLYMLLGDKHETIAHETGWVIAFVLTAMYFGSPGLGVVSEAYESRYSRKFSMSRPPRRLRSDGDMNGATSELPTSHANNNCGNSNPIPSGTDGVPSRSEAGQKEAALVQAQNSERVPGPRNPQTVRFEFQGGLLEVDAGNLESINIQKSGQHIVATVKLVQGGSDKAV